MVNLGPFGRFLSWSVDRTERDEKAYVDEPDRLPRVWRWSAGSYLAAFVCWVGTLLLDEGNAVRGVFVGVVGFYIGTTALHRLRSARAYRNGWLDGRFAMLFTMQEAQARGLSMDEWLTSELEKNHAVIARM